MTRRLHHGLCYLEQCIAMRVLSWSVMVLLAAIGCHTDALLPPSPELDQLPWEMEINHPAITLTTNAPDNTIQVMVTLRNVRGEAIPLEKAPVFRNLDTLVVVDSLGVITGLHPVRNARVVVTVVQHNSRFEDTVFVNVNNLVTAPVIDSVVLIKPPDGILQVPVFQGTFDGAFPSVKAQAYSNGTVASNIVFVYQASDSSKISVDRLTGLLGAKDTGDVTVYVYSTAYGRQFRDSIICHMTYPAYGFIGIEQVSMSADAPRKTGFFPGSLTVSRGATVFWVNRSLEVSDVIFDDPSLVEPSPFDLAGDRGNIPEFLRTDTPQWIGGGAYRVRSFPVAGVYRFRNSDGATGEIVVNDL